MSQKRTGKRAQKTKTHALPPSLVVGTAWLPAIAPTAYNSGDTQAPQVWPTGLEVSSTAGCGRFRSATLVQRSSGVTPGPLRNFLEDNILK